MNVYSQKSASIQPRTSPPKIYTTLRNVEKFENKMHFRRGLESSAPFTAMWVVMIGWLRLWDVHRFWRNRRGSNPRGETHMFSWQGEQPLAASTFENLSFACSSYLGVSFGILEMYWNDIKPASVFHEGSHRNMHQFKRIIYIANVALFCHVL